MVSRLSKATKLKLIIPLLYALIAVVYFVWAWPINTKVYHFIGIAITLVSFVLWITARIQLGNAFSIAPKSKYLVKNGLYSKLRHPVYYFSIAVVVGLAIFAWQVVWVLLLIALVVLEVIRTRKEEALLSDSFGRTYRSYKEQPWF